MLVTHTFLLQFVLVVGKKIHLYILYLVNTFFPLIKCTVHRESLTSTLAIYLLKVMSLVILVSHRNYMVLLSSGSLWASEPFFFFAYNGWWVEIISSLLCASETTRGIIFF